MKFICPKCKGIITRDMRLNATKALINKKGYYKSWCGDNDCVSYCKPFNKLKK